MARLIAILLALSFPQFAAATPPSEKVLADATGLPVEVSGDVAKISKPRTDINAIVDDRALKPFQGITSWAAFQQAGNATMVMGDIVLLEHEVNPALSAALENGLEVTALHNHFFYDEPRIYFMHIGGSGDEEKLAHAVRAVFDAAENAENASAFAGPAIPADDSIDPAPLAKVFGVQAQTKDGMAKFVFGRTTKMHGTSAGAAMGVNTWVTFAGSNASAVVDGDFAMLEGELQGVLRALRAANINVVAIHSHMVQEDPRLLFLHFWGKGSAETLAQGINAALATQKIAG